MKENRIEPILRLAAACGYEREHAQQVKKIALCLFDGLRTLHRLKQRHRFLLEAAGILHDIGWRRGQKRHHKTSRDIILAADDLPFSGAERTMVALIARYHRNALPKKSHKYYADLSAREKITVRILAAFLRCADGLDRSHSAAVDAVSCRATGKNITLKISPQEIPGVDRHSGQLKSDLLNDVFRRKILIA
ncbi:MAG: HD domain-containing protein [Candidatus Omnitrophica bacterium]|nr:HD domain-containing protein [Candidatus Omnitrophota bacterium]MBU4477654.1 HD domain-containing protein [Candidatus Omnitrophota bacterium]MCG2703144.1 HD domain-containing protein [Candidatus Omnitrophota bacterium]